MRKLWQAGCPMVALALTVISAATAAEGERADWSHLMRFQVRAQTGRELLQMALPPRVFDLARPDLGDLRLIGPRGSEIPHVVRFARGSVERRRLPARLYNRGYVPGRHASATVDLGERVMKNRVRIESSGTDFRREVVVEGSQDARDWAVLRENAFLLSFRGREGRADYTREEINLPLNDYRYLRVTVHNAPRDPKRIGVEDVVCWRLEREPAETVPVEMDSPPLIRVDEVEEVQEITLDLGYRKLPLSGLSLQFGDENFFRHVDLLGRNRNTRTVRKPREDAAPVFEEVEQPWHRVGRDGIYRYSTGGSVDESLTLGLGDARYRYIQLRIHNYDNPPLEFEGAGVTRFRCYLEFPPGSPGSYLLYVGNSDIEPPRYDLARYVDRLRREGTGTVEPTAVVTNPAHAVGEDMEAGGLHPAVLWGALLAAVAFLGYLVWRVARGAERQPAGGEGDQP
ncbi:MAG: DUF3999 family protein [Planctomycetota bacterium]